MQSQVIATPRIYYYEEKLQGDPIETKYITLKAFDFIMQNAQSRQYRNKERNKMILVDGEFEFVDIDQFKYSIIRKDGLAYTADEGSFYLPEAIIFLDSSDYRPYPSEFYFIARIQNQLELCRCSGGEGVKWYQLADRYTTVTDSIIIEKASKTMEVLNDFIAYEIEQEKEAEAERMEQTANLQPISAEKKEAYIALTEICMPKNAKKKDVLALIDELKESETVFDTFRLYQNHHQIPFVISVDWKDAVGELNAWVSAAAKENFRKSFRFDLKGVYGDYSSLSDDGLFSAFDYQLRKIGLQLTIIETDGDEYQLIVHPPDDEKRVKEAMTKIGIHSQQIPD